MVEAIQPKTNESPTGESVIMLDENGQEIPFFKVKKLGSGDYGDVFLFQTQGIKVDPGAKK